VIKHFSGWAVGVGLGGLVKCGDARTGFPLWLIYLAALTLATCLSLRKLAGTMAMVARGLAYKSFWHVWSSPVSG
jgi:hypothetical protein